MQCNDNERQELYPLSPDPAVLGDFNQQTCTLSATTNEQKIQTINKPLNNLKLLLGTTKQQF